MSGVLDSKKRILDVVLTEIGREQMNRGEFNVSFVSFSDKGVVYDHDKESNVISDISDRLYFEAYSSPSDEIIPEIDNTGDFILTKKVSPTLTVNNGELFEQTASGYQKVDAFANMSSFTNILTGRYDGLQILRSENKLENFSIFPEGSVSMLLPEKITGIDIAASYGKPILVDPRFSGSLNTLFLAPTSMNAEGNKVPLRAYNRFGNDHTKENTIAEIKDKSRGHMSLELGTKDTYTNYNLIGQVFMKQDQSIKKYVVVDAGEFTNGIGKVDTHVYHLGFVFKDDIGTSKFLRAFSLVFSEGEV